jgi:predicted nucleotide-binding protein
VNLLKLEKLLKEKYELTPIILRNEPGKGRTIIEKFEDEAKKASFAFAIFTPDDFVEIEGIKYSQARPNTIFELGWFFGYLKRKYVCILCKKGTKIHSDLEGINRIDFENSVEEKILDIERELKDVGLINN